MKKKEIICAFYDRNDTERNEYNDFMRNIVNHKKKLKPLYYENIDGKILIVFYKKKLKSIKKFIVNENVEFFNSVMSGKYKHCSKCGCGYMAYQEYTYRDNCGCVGRSYECPVCQEYPDKAVHKISEYAIKHGSKKTIMKLLKDDAFNERISEDPYADELPF